MAEQAWKATQRRIARQWGGQGAWRGAHGSDGVGCPVSLEVTRTKNRQIESRKVQQAIAQGRAEGKPFVLVVAGHRDPRPVAVVDHGWLVELARKAGLLGRDTASPFTEPQLQEVP